jgi:hypothetical protein
MHPIGRGKGAAAGQEQHRRRESDERFLIVRIFRRFSPQSCGPSSNETSVNGYAQVMTFTDDYRFG